MKRALRLLVLLIVCPFALEAQITLPAIRANFGVDADLRCNFFNGLVQSGNDDWFLLPGSVGTGQFVIDTTGAAAHVARYAVDPAFRRLPFYRTMRYPTYSVVNNRLLIDAVFTRDYHGEDSTIFASGSNKNGMSPAIWTCPVAQSVPDKNEILDMMCHVRRAGPTVSDSLWLFGGVSIENTTGNRYFDFEMYQTDIYYDRASRRFYGYGPDAGHTSWRFDGSGNITVPGDIVFSAEYSSSALTMLEARIWVSKADWLTVTPLDFDWSGLFDGDGNGALYGYASIRPKNGGTFYTGLQSASNTWAGPFQLVIGDNSILTTYTARQFMEFSVNLTKLGLDPVTLLGGNSCGMPFRRVLVKSRASTSFTSELKDFIGPFDFFLAPRADIRTDAPYLCDTGSVGRIYVNNYVPTSTYQWTTIGGNILTTPPTGPYIDVDRPGTYIVTQYLQSGCSAYATDTITILPFASCEVLSRNLYDVTGVYNNNAVKLDWKVLHNMVVGYFDVERSTDGINFTSVGRVDADAGKGTGAAQYEFTDAVGELAGRTLYYRIKLQETGTKYYYSNVLRMSLKSTTGNAVSILPNPVKDIMQVQINAVKTGSAQLTIYDPMGKLVKTVRLPVQKGYNTITVDDLADKPRGMYHAVIIVDEEQFTEKILVIR